MTTAPAAPSLSTRRGRPSAVLTLVYALTAVSSLLLLLTGLTGFLQSGRLSGLPLILHVGLSPLFLWGLAVVAWFRQPVRTADFYSRAAATTFWLLVLTGTVLGLSMLIVMSALVGPEGRDRLVLLHRVAGFIFAGGSLLHLLVFIMQRLSRRT